VKAITEGTYIRWQIPWIQEYSQLDECTDWQERTVMWTHDALYGTCIRIDIHGLTDASNKKLHPKQE
jgi:hypothetical protein